MRILVQEQYLPGPTATDRFEQALALGFDGLELRCRGGFSFRRRLDELRAARRAGAVMPTACEEMTHFVGAFDPELRADALAQVKSHLSVMAEIGGRGVLTPASWGMWSNRLPPFDPPRSPEEDHEVLCDSFGRLAEHAASEGVVIMLEPLNRYEDHMINRLEQAVALIEEVGSPSFRLVADTFHMNIEEADPAAALERAMPYLAHVQASDTNRLEPGAGHLDWPLMLRALTDHGYEGDIALESRLSGPADEVLPRVPALLRRYL